MTTKVEIPPYASARVSRRVSCTVGPTLMMASVGLLMAASTAVKGDTSPSHSNAYKVQPIPSFGDDGITARNKRRLEAKADRKRRPR